MFHSELKAGMADNNVHEESIFPDVQKASAQQCGRRIDKQGDL